jgi:hypothetical protein
LEAERSDGETHDAERSVWCWNSVHVPDSPGNRPVRRTGRTEVRGAIVAKKPGNAGRAKGSRKMENGSGQTTTDRSMSPRTYIRDDSLSGNETGTRDLFLRCPDPVLSAGDREVSGVRRYRAWQGAQPLPVRDPPALFQVNHQPESRVRETRTHGSEGRGTQTNASSLPLSLTFRVGRTTTLCCNSPTTDNPPNTTTPAAIGNRGAAFGWTTRS